MKRILLGLFIIVCLIFITGCGKKVNITGKYKLVEIVDGNTTISSELLKATGYEYKLEVKKDKTAILKMGNNKQKLKYDKKYFYLSSGKAVYSYDKGTLILKDSKSSMTFEKE